MRLPLSEDLAWAVEVKLKACLGLAAARADWVKVLGTKGDVLVVLVVVGLAWAG